MYAWERQRYDTDESWLAFQAFRDAFPRKAVRVMVGGRLQDPVKVADWIRDHFWNERVAAYDVHLDQIRTHAIETAHAQTAREVAAEHMEILSDARNVALIELKKLLDRAKQGGFEVMRPHELIRLMDAIVKNDRLIRDMSTEKHEHSGRLDLSASSDAELAELEERLRKITGDDTASKDDSTPRH